MCGIAGIVNTGNMRIDEHVLRNMTDRMIHRGPDDGGVQIVDGPAGSGISAGLGHRRLSIIDLSAKGHQPMPNEDHSVWITFNGEIYNYKDLRNVLVSKGHRFRSETDTEVILHGYEEYGGNICEKISGMFAFGIWDTRIGRLLLGRDRFGKKPLYYWNTPQALAFASELKAFLAIPDFRPSLDLRSFSRYLAYEYVPAPHTIYDGVKKVPPGTCVLYQDAQLSITSFWDVTLPQGTPAKMSDTEAEHTLLELLKKAVEKRLMSDVALGAFLSGGIDSSAVVAMMSELMDSRLIKTFSIGFEDKSFDESGYARRVARHFNTDHHERFFTASDMFDIMPRVWDILDEPLADASILPTYMLSKFTRETVTVALGGDGGDELFAGYDPFVAHRLATVYQKIPRWIRRAVLEPLAMRLPVSSSNMSVDFRIKQFLKGAANQPAVRNQVWLGAFDLQQQKELLNPEVCDSLKNFDPYDDIRAAAGTRNFRDWVDEITFVYQRFYMGEDILTKVDRASMAVSLEVRTPFLDREFSEFANALPSHYKLRGLTRKFILKNALKGKLPRDIINRKKKGFGIPLTKWLRHDLRPMLEELFSEQRIKKEGLFNSAYVHRLMNEHFEGKKDNRKQLWTLLMFEQWKERFFNRPRNDR